MPVISPMVTNATKKDKGFGQLLVVTLVAMGLAEGLAMWIPGPVAAGLSVFAVGSVFYWIPPKPQMPYQRWLVHIIKYAALTLLAVVVFNVVSKPLRTIVNF